MTTTKNVIIEEIESEEEKIISRLKDLRVQKTLDEIYSKFSQSFGSRFVKDGYNFTLLGFQSRTSADLISLEVDSKFLFKVSVESSSYDNLLVFFNLDERKIQYIKDEMIFHFDDSQKDVPQ